MSRELPGPRPAGRLPAHEHDDCACPHASCHRSHPSTFAAAIERHRRQERWQNRQPDNTEVQQRQTGELEISGPSKHIRSNPGACVWLVRRASDTCCYHDAGTEDVCKKTTQFANYLLSTRQQVISDSLPVAGLIRIMPEQVPKVEMPTGLPALTSSGVLGVDMSQLDHDSTGLITVPEAMLCRLCAAGSVAKATEVMRLTWYVYWQCSARYTTLPKMKPCDRVQGSYSTLAPKGDMSGLHCRVKQTCRISCALRIRSVISGSASNEDSVSHRPNGVLTSMQ